MTGVPLKDTPYGERIRTFLIREMGYSHMDVEKFYQKGLVNKDALNFYDLCNWEDTRATFNLDLKAAHMSCTMKMGAASWKGYTFNDLPNPGPKIIF